MRSECIRMEILCELRLRERTLREGQIVGERKELEMRGRAERERRESEIREREIRECV